MLLRVRSHEVTMEVKKLLCLLTRIFRKGASNEQIQHTVVGYNDMTGVFQLKMKTSVQSFSRYRRGAPLKPQKYCLVSSLIIISKERQRWSPGACYK